VRARPEFELRQAGDSALVLARPEAIDAELNDWCLAAAHLLRASLGAAVREVVIGYCTVTIYFDPLACDPRWLEDEVRTIVGAAEIDPGTAGPTIDVPVRYGGEHGPDLEDVAAFGGCSPADVVALHTAVVYRVFLVGFVPGFPYMAAVDPRIARPRRASPRTHVPAGSVAIAGPQTGIYPSETPGGWNIVGRTPVKPYDPSRQEPFLFRPGAQVRFRAIDATDYERMAR
jgi:KipI family sensor histidine kinase inhibitor